MTHEEKYFTFQLNFTNKGEKKNVWEAGDVHKDSPFSDLTEVTIESFLSISAFSYKKSIEVLFEKW